MAGKPVSVVLFGPSGIDKKTAAKNLRTLCEKLLPACRVQCLDIGDFLNTNTHLLLHRPAKAQQKEISEAMGRMSSILTEADLNLIGIHAAHLCAGIVTFPCIEDSIRNLHPDVFVTLLDDVYSCRSRLAQGGYPFRFNQLLMWRQIECGIADYLANVLDVENVYFAAKHPRVTLYRFLFEPDRPRVYSAHQITETRDSPELAAEIDKHRRRLHKEYTVFDPLTIDDRILINSLPTTDPPPVRFDISQDNRWDCDLSDLGSEYASLVGEEGALFPLQVELWEARELASPAERSSRRNVIDVQIRHRDFKYIDQSDIVSAYRPCLHGHESSGVAAEKTYAAGTGERTVVEYSPQEDLDKLPSKPFTPPIPGPLCTNLKQFYESLAGEARKAAQKRYSRRKDKYSVLEDFRKTFSRGPDHHS